MDLASVVSISSKTTSVPSCASLAHPGAGEFAAEESGTPDGDIPSQAKVLAGP
jgi:hypothetical protein